VKAVLSFLVVSMFPAAEACPEPCRDHQPAHPTEITHQSFTPHTVRSLPVKTSDNRCRPSSESRASGRTRLFRRNQGDAREKSPVDTTELND
jgi:hypothetical protein